MPKRLARETSPASRAAAKVPFAHLLTATPETIAGYDLIRTIRAQRKFLSDYLRTVDREELIRLYGEGRETPLDLIDLQLQILAAQAVDVVNEALHSDDWRERAWGAEQALDRRSYTGVKRTAARGVVELGPQTIALLERGAAAVDDGSPV